VGSWRGSVTPPCGDGCTKTRSAHGSIAVGSSRASIQARQRKQPTRPPRPGTPTRVEHEYARGGAWAYLAGLDVHRARLFGRCERPTGIAPFDRLVDQVMTQPPYCDARRVFWIVDNGSSHRGDRCVRRLTAKYPRLVPVHGPVHGSRVEDWRGTGRLPLAVSAVSSFVPV
jgi:hypothetical protein